jgi:hypothetical protein
MKRAEGLSVSDAQTPTLKPPPRQELHAAGMRVVQAKLSRDMCPDLSRRSTELSVQPNAQRRFVGRCHAGLTPLPPVGAKRVPAANGVVVYVQKLCDGLAGLRVIKQHDPIGAQRNTVVFALAANPDLKHTAQGEKESRGRSGAHLKRPRPARHHIKIRVLDDSEYNPKKLSWTRRRRQFCTTNSRANCHQKTPPGI